MADGLINVAFDAASLGIIDHLGQFGTFLEPQMSAAMSKIGDLLVTATEANTWTAFQHPTGNLASHIAAQLQGPLEVIITVDVPYAWRLEAGFVGTDSLGRNYNEAAEPYAMPALVASEDEILVIVGLAAAETFALIGGGGV
jgi:hypothetical protein